MVARHKKVDGFDQIQADIFHYLDTLAKKPGAVKSSKALKSRAELKVIYDTYFSKRTKDFIALLRSNAEKSYDDILKTLREYGRTGILYESTGADEIEDRINQQTGKQIARITQVYFPGGNRHVH